MAADSLSAGVVSFEEARHIVEKHARTVSPAATESAELLSASGRVLAESILADRDFPPFPRATRDGYAVRAQDLAKVPASLQVIGEIKAGDHNADLTVQPGQAASVMTGAPLPSGADAVVMVEYSSLAGTVVEITRGVKSGENFVPRGAAVF